MLGRILKLYRALLSKENLKMLFSKTSYSNLLSNILDNVIRRKNISYPKKTNNYCRLQQLLLAFNDNKSARERDVCLQVKNGSNMRANLMLLFLCFVLIFCVIVLIFYRNKLSSDVVAIISGLTGALGQCLKDVFHFEFGSSRFKNNH